MQGHEVIQDLFRHLPAGFDLEAERLVVRHGFDVLQVEAYMFDAGVAYARLRSGLNHGDKQAIYVEAMRRVGALRRGEGYINILI